MSGARQTDLCGLLRHQAPGRNRVPERLRLAGQRPRTSRLPRRAAAAARHRVAGAGRMRDFSERQSQLFFLIITFLRQLPAAGASAAHRRRRRRGDGGAGRRRSKRRRAASSTSTGPRRCRPSGWSTALKPVLAEAGTGLGSAFERDAAVVLRRVEEAATRVRAAEPDNRRAFLDLLGRVIKAPSERIAAEGAPTVRGAALDSAVIARYTWGLPVRDRDSGAGLGDCDSRE